MNDALTQYCPDGMITKQRVLNYNEITELYQKLQIIKYKKINEINCKQYGYYYDDKSDTVILNKKIPKTFAELGKCIIYRLGINMRFNNVEIKMYENEQHIKSIVDDVDLGEKTLFFVIGDLCPFKLINLKNAKKTYETKLYTGGCIFLEGESRYLWIYSTIPMLGKRWIIIFRDIPRK